MAGANFAVIGGDRSLGASPLGLGNLISGNSASGIKISGPDSQGHQIMGNNIGVDRTGAWGFGNGGFGIIVENGATNTNIGDSSAGMYNILSGNGESGISIRGADTINNVVQNNFIGSDGQGRIAIPNGVHGIEVRDGAHNNKIGGDRLAGEGNLLSGNLNHGLVITFGAHHNEVYGNLIGPDASGMISLGRQDNGGVDLAEGASQNEIGRLENGYGNIISGNSQDGIAIFSNGANSYNNRIVGNVIGLAIDGETPLPNRADGILGIPGANLTLIQGNTISANLLNGIRLTGSSDRQATITSNLIGVNISGTLAVPNGGYGIQLDYGAHGHTIQDNTIAGNKLGGILIAAMTGQAPYSNTIRDNFIGTDSSGSLFLSNQGPDPHHRDGPRQCDWP
jgi:titin